MMLILEEEMPEKDTKELNDEIAECYGRREFEELVRENEGLFRDWEKKIGPMLDNGPRGRISNKQMMEAFGLSINCVSGFRHAIPAKRRSVIMIAALLQLSVAETNDLLSRWAKFQKLYAKNPEDAIWMYILNNGGSDRPRELFEAYWDIYTDMRWQELRKRGTVIRQNTMALEEQINRVRRADGVLPMEDVTFVNMMRDYIRVYEDGYQKLADYIEDQFIRVSESHSGLLTEEELNALRENKKITPNILFQNDESYKNRFYTRIRNIRRKHEVPKRAFLISIGIRLAMSTAQIDKMLRLAGMQPLCAKDRLESALIFYLEELYLYYHSFFRQNEDTPENERQMIDCELKDLMAMGEDGPMLCFNLETEAPSERLTSYIRRCLEESQIFSDADWSEDSDLSEFLGLL